MTPLPRRPVLLAAAGASVGAGMVHAAAAGAHADDRTLAALFALAAVLQVSWAVGVVAVPSRPLVSAGVLLQAGFVGVWAVSRTTGIGLVDGLARAQEISFQDGATAVLEVVAALAATASLRPAGDRDGRARAGRRPWHPALTATAAAGIVALVVPAMAFPHDHDHDRGGARVDVAAGGAALSAEHAHDDAGDHAHPDTSGDHAHADVPGDDAHPDTSGVDARLAGAPGVEATTAEQRRRAVELIEATVAAIGRFADPVAAEAAGYRSIGDGFTGFEHFVNRDHLADAAVLDPATVESLVYRVLPDGTRELASGMYILPPGTTMADVPDVAGPLTVWHDHQNLCWHPDGSLAGVLVDGECRPAGTFRATPPMLHVWIVDHPCGPFAGIDGSHGSGCAHDHG